MKRNRLTYAALLILLAPITYVSGERLLYVALTVLAALPMVSYAAAFFMLRILRVSQSIPQAVVKNEPHVIKIAFYNVAPIIFADISCKFFTDFAVTVEEEISHKFTDGFVQEIPFTACFRGTYVVGLRSVCATDLLGLFSLTRRMRRKVKLLVLPRVVELEDFPLAMNVLTQANSRFDLKDEDYATISDIRQYLPTDSIKRVHWKLTAKRSEWLVKNFQSNALNRVTMLFDTQRLNVPYRQYIAIEDRMVELAMGLARFCLRRGMPVDFSVGEGMRVECRHPSAFESVYQAGGVLSFEKEPPRSTLSMLSQYLNDAIGYLNIVILTPLLDAVLNERILNGVNNGHHICVIYFPTMIKDRESEDIYRLLDEGGMPVLRIDDDTLKEKKMEEVLQSA